jgi:uncharacterized protein YecE (DUF72 family)
MIYVGTSGFNYDDWVDTFYPPDLPKHKWLVHYAREFDACEIDSTYYAVPKPANLRTMARKTGDGFLFSIKATQELTHHTEGNEAVFEAFREAISPLIELKRLGCILAQFPYSFELNRQNWDYLRSLRQRLNALPVVVEFRNGRWLRDEVFGWLRNLGLGFCCVDESPVQGQPPPAEATGQISYVRFSGRGRAGRQQADRKHDYPYSKAELSQWVPRIRRLESMSDMTFVFAGNHTGGRAITTVRQLRAMLA